VTDITEHPTREGKVYCAVVLDACSRRVELLDRRRWRTRLELANAIFDFLEIFHNRQRRHSALGDAQPGRVRDPPAHHRRMRIAGDRVAVDATVSANGNQHRDSS
jgi:transposase InsO family protein